MQVPGEDAASRPRDGSESPAAASAFKRVVLIERCSGVQYGRYNEQYSVYRASLSSVALESSETLAQHLLSGDRPWVRDVFTHNGRASFAGLAGTGGSFGGATEALADDTLVIIRNSRGVQVGDGNTQHNNFRIRITNVAIKAEHVGQTEGSRAAVDRLCKHPSQAAAEALARLIADAARDRLVLDLTAQVTQEVGSPVISGQPTKISGQTGIQAGGSARAHVNVKVKVAHVNIDNLARVLLAAARRVRTVAAQATEMEQLADLGDDRGERHPRAVDRGPGAALVKVIAAEVARRDAARTARVTGIGSARGPDITSVG